MQSKIDLAAVSGLALLAAALTFFGGGPASIQVVLGVVLVLVLPGYALVRAVVAGELGVMERVVLSLGASIGLAVLGGFVLNLTPWGIAPRSWAVLLATVTLVCCAVAALRHGKGLPSPAQPLALPWSQAALFGLAATVVVAAVVLARNGAINQPTPGFTQFWLLPANAERGIQVGIHNQESVATTYTLELAANNQPLNNVPPVTLQPGASWETTVTLPANQSYGTLEARLYRGSDSSQIYRQAALQIGQ